MLAKYLGILFAKVDSIKDIPRKLRPLIVCLPLPIYRAPEQRCCTKRKRGSHSRQAEPCVKHVAFYIINI